MNKNDAKQFLYELNDFSAQAIPLLTGKSKSQTDKHSGTFKPVGMTLHYTAGQSDRVTSLINYFISNPAKVSSWCFILDGKHPKLELLEKDYPLIEALPATVLQFGPVDRKYWHGGWVNKIHVGIDLRNAGKLEYKGGKFFDGYGRDYNGRKPVKKGRFYWEPYTKAQIQTTAHVCDAVRKHFDMREPERFLPHTGSKKTKLDTGPAFPIEEMRNYVYGLDPAAMDSGLWDGQCLEGYPESSPSIEECEAGGQDLLLEQMEDGLDDDVALLEDTAFIMSKADTIPLKKYQAGLKILGYHVEIPFINRLSESLKITTQYFQKANKLAVDGKPGPKTFAAMEALLKVWI